MRDKVVLVVANHAVLGALLGLLVELMGGRPVFPLRASRQRTPSAASAFTCAPRLHAQGLVGRRALLSSSAEWCHRAVVWCVENRDRGEGNCRTAGRERVRLPDRGSRLKPSSLRDPHPDPTLLMDRGGRESVDALRSDATGRSAERHPRAGLSMPVGGDCRRA